MTPLEAASRLIHACPNGARLLVAISGGSDSKGLLLALHQAAQTLQRTDLRLFAATVDHDLRQGSADEALQVRAFCQKLSIPHHIARWQEQKPKTGIAAAARMARYHLLGEIAHDVSADVIVTGHTLNDQQETILMRSERSEPDAAGLSGMAHATLFQRKNWIVRPFLAVQRDDIRRYLVAQNVSWIDDPSNDNEAYERVRVRKSIANEVAQPDLYVEAGAARLQRSQDVADFLKDHAAIHLQSVAVMDWPATQTDPVGLAALAVLVAIMGGQSHQPGREQIQKLKAALDGGDLAVLSLSRCVVTFRKCKIHISREARALPRLQLPVGQSGIWDQRSFIRNSRAEDIEIIPGAGEVSAAAVGFLPKSVANRALKTLPTVRVSASATPAPVTGSGPAPVTGIEIQPVFPLFDVFLPIFDLPVANCVSKLFDRPAFPPFLLHYI